MLHSIVFFTIIGLMNDKSTLRQSIRAKRQQLSQGELKQASIKLKHQLLSLSALKQSRHIAIYWPSDGEISPLLCLPAWREKHIYLPRILSRKRMIFHRYYGQKLLKNRYGIAEAVATKSLQPSKLDAILLPLVGFDQCGNRLGMGGGYYDRCLAFKQHKPHSKKPALIGLGHHFQQQAEITTSNWDVTLDYIITEQEIIKR